MSFYQSEIDETWFAPPQSPQYSKGFDEAWFEQMQRLRCCMDLPGRDQRSEAAARDAYARKDLTEYRFYIQHILEVRMSMLLDSLIAPRLDVDKKDLGRYLSGAVTYFSRLPGMQPPYLASLFNWEQIEARINREFMRLGCAAVSKRGRCGHPNGPEAGCIRYCIGQFLADQEFSATRLLDRILPNKGAFSLQLNLPDGASDPMGVGAQFYREIVALQAALRNGPDARDVRLVNPCCTRFLTWDEGPGEAAQGASSELTTFLEDFYRQFSGLYLFASTPVDQSYDSEDIGTPSFDKANLKVLAGISRKAGQPGYRFSDFLDIAVFSLIVPDVRYLHFYHFGSGASVDVPERSGLAAGSGVLVLASTLELPVDVRYGIFALTHIAISAVARLEYSLEREEELAGKIAHSVANRFGSITALIKEARTSPSALKQVLYRVAQMETMMKAVSQAVRGAGKSTQLEFKAEPVRTLLAEVLNEVVGMLAYERQLMGAVFCGGDLMDPVAATAKLRELLPAIGYGTVKGRVRSCRVLLESLVLEALTNTIENMDISAPGIELTADEDHRGLFLEIKNRVAPEKQALLKELCAAYEDDNWTGLGLRAMRTYSHLLRVPPPQLKSEEGRGTCCMKMYIGRREEHRS